MSLLQRAAGEHDRAPSDSVPPLSAGHEPDHRPRRSRAALVAMLAAGLCAAAGAAVWSRAEAAPASAPPPLAAAEPPAAKPAAAEPPVAKPAVVEAPVAAPEPEDPDPEPQTLDDQIERLFGRLRAELWLSDAEMAKVEAIFAASPVLSQGNPVITKHPMSRAECRKIRADAGLPPVHVDNRCGAPNMVPIYNPIAGDTPETATVCIDQFEFPDIPCEYPVVHVRASEAADLCEAVGKRLCDAHEWEGACAGAVLDPSVEYVWPRPRMEAEFWHNHDREIVWSYGPTKNHALCGTNSDRTPDCPGGGWNKCGSNTYPAGAFPACVSSFGVYDLHGNAAEHMNLPTRPEELRMQNGGGMTEMKGSWFVFSKIEAHQDDCRWRAPAWHESRVRDPGSHRNYHLGFRCCKDVGE